MAPQLAGVFRSDEKMISRMSSLRYIARLVACTFFFVICAKALPAQDVTLRYKWTKGDVVRYRLTMQQTGSVVSLPQAFAALGALQGISIDQKTTQTIRIDVDDVSADGTITLREVVEAVRFERNIPAIGGATGKAVFDTANGDKASTPDQMAVASVVGEPITILMSSNGAVQKVDGMSRVLDKLAETFPSNVSGQLNALKESLNDQTMAAFMTLAQFPERALKSGDTWDRERNVSMPMIGKLTTSETFTFQGVEDNVAHIKLNTKGKQDSVSPLSLPSASMQIHLEDSSGEGDSFFDVAKGRMQRSNSSTTGTMTMNMAVSLPNGDGNPQNLSITMKTTSSTLMELSP
jgi:hypothetical protein